MKEVRKKKLDISFRIYGIAQFLQIIFFILCLILVFLIAQQEHMSFNELMTLSPVSNMIYLVAMMNAICFIELAYFKKMLKENKDTELVFVNVAIVALAEFMTLNMPIALCLVYFIYSTMKKNHKKFKDQLIYVKNNKQYLVPVINFVVLMFATLICYKLLML